MRKFLLVLDQVRNNNTSGCKGGMQPLRVEGVFLDGQNARTVTLAQTSGKSPNGIVGGHPCSVVKFDSYDDFEPPGAGWEFNEAVAEVC